MGGGRQVGPGVSLRVSAAMRVSGPRLAPTSAVFCGVPVALYLLTGGVGRVGCSAL